MGSSSCVRDDQGQLQFTSITALVDLGGWYDTHRGCRYAIRSNAYRGRRGCTSLSFPSSSWIRLIMQFIDGEGNHCTLDMTYTLQAVSPMQPAEPYPQPPLAWAPGYPPPLSMHPGQMQPMGQPM